MTLENTDQVAGRYLTVMQDEDGVDIDEANPMPARILSGGNEVDVNSDGQMHVVMQGHLCTNNSTTTPLLADAVFTGIATDILAYNGICVFITSNVASATAGLEIQYSADGLTNWRTAESYTILAGAEKWFTPPSFGKFFRLVYTNGGSDQTSLEITTVMRKTPFKWSSHNIDEAITDQDDAELVKAVITGKKVNGDYDNVNLTNGANMKVSLEELESGISSNSNSQLNVTLYDAGGIPAEIDNSTHALECITHEHHEIHAGDHYFVDGYADLTINQVMDFTWQMPNTTKWTHWIWKLSVESETLYQVYELAVATNPLANTITPINNNRNSDNTSATTMKYEVQANLAAANADTAIGGATLIATGIIGAGRDGGVDSRSKEIILKQNTLYCLRSTATAAGYQNFVMEWYEHTDKD